ncbi:MAG: imidazoleglycerol-phosphate dehydratase HisB [Methanolinea sp.]|jgi:imidazoleglycerol-phosphate dehydratase|nr:imidazoleglycerol-phosphate dehydratase HisB [Methanolinea sp.]
MRHVHIHRETRETSIDVSLDLDSSNGGEISTGIAFFDHMLTSMARHGQFGLSCRAEGDLDVDVHHTVEDTGIVLGQAFREAIGEGKGITRFAHALIPMDESLATVALDCGGRGYLVFRGAFSHPRVGGIEREIFEHFFYSLCIKAGITAHLAMEGKNDHHKCEALFKAFGIALGLATRIGKDTHKVPSTKGIL